jgi:hypothetical protein
MANSPLDFPSTQSFRNRLNGRNLVPYPKSPRRITPPINYEFIQSDYHVIDSPDQTIDVPTFANSLYPLNQYGSSGGYIQARDPNSLLNTHSNEGEYGVQDANIIDEARTEARNWRSLNPYGSGSNDLIDSANNFSSLEILQLSNNGTSNAQPYPTTFVSSFYSPVSILLSTNPRGSSGSLSQDSFLVRLGAKTLRKEFEERIAAELYRQTLGRVNVPGLNPVLNTIGALNGTVPIVQPNYQITVPSNPIVYAADFALRLAGTRLPFSPIPGSYFDSTINPGQPTTIQQIANAYNNTVGQTQVGQFLASILGTPKTGSQIFLNNTGGGQKKRLFFNIDYNRYKPGYDRTLIDRLGGAIFGTTFDNSNYYIGSPNSEPSRVLSPSRAIPVNEFGKEVPSPVFGPSEIAQLYEGEVSKQIKLGANGPTYSDGGGIEGGMTWVSPKYKGNAGKKVGIGGEIVKDDTDYKESSYVSTESTNTKFRAGSILDDTQRIINSQPQGGKRLQHVGNAIDQVSKVFNDGYKELTKGSRVLAYVGEIGQEKGAEYCRVFAKDIPYLQYNDLQKTDGIVTEGRRFSYSVLDKTYNLNMYPNKREGGQDSTNLIGGSGTEGKAKKYMFSLENLAWRTSNKPGYTVSDLPVCERGPNGGRVMWFPPYDLKFTEGSSANWKGTDFLGRPEPIYTYNNTTRTGTLSWKIVVDHPSVLNVVVNKVLAKETNKTRINSILDSFFAGCRKYDLYDLAKKYYTVNPNDILQIQKELQYNDVTTERVEYIKQTLTTGQDNINTVEVPTTVPDTLTPNFLNKAVYFGNDYPKPGNNNQNYTIEYGRYTEPSNISLYQTNNSTAPSFFNSVITPNYQDMEKLAIEINKLLSDEKNSGTISLTIAGSASAPATQSYNISLSQRRINSLKAYFEENTNTKTHITNKRLLLIDGAASGENAQVQQYDLKDNKWTQGTTYSCSDNDGKGDNNGVSHEIYTINAMACRRASISKISVNLNTTTTKEEKTTVNKTEEYETAKTYKDTKKVPEEVSKTVVRDNISKRVLRALLTECDYFETIKEETPMAFDNLREKLKFFNPAFHSTTPEGLNSRLTFLQQCLRPGDTIPVKNTDGTLQYNNATNTAFGVPPVLVLRVGDFYHSKIIPDNLQLTYEGLDINPEGIGIQPMIANVTLSFKFVGGQGLAGAVDRLQNALTFNYYANTEIYDDRSDVTDTSYQVIDKQFLDYFNIQVPPPTVNQVQNNDGQSNGQTIGLIITATTTTSGDTGIIGYQGFFNGLVDETQNYFTNVVNKNKEVSKQYNNAIRQFWTFDRGYTTGNLTYLSGSETKIFGKPINVETKINELFNDFIDDIENENECLISFIKGTPTNPKNFSTKVITTLKSNYKNYIKTTKKNNFISALTKIIQDFSILQQNYVKLLSKANTVSFRGSNIQYGTDGYQQSNGNIKLYFISGITEPNSQPVTDSMTDMLNDLTTLKGLLNDFYQLTNSATTFNYSNVTKEGKLRYSSNEITKLDVFKNFSDLFNNNRYINGVDARRTALKRSYAILNDDIIDSVKYQTFKNIIIGNILSNPSIFGSGDTELEKEFDAFWVSQADSVKSIYVDENNATNKFFEEIESKGYSKYLKGTSQTFLRTKKREFSFKTSVETETDSIKRRQSLIKSLGASTNSKTNTDTWCDDIDIVHIGKVKFN